MVGGHPPRGVRRHSTHSTGASRPPDPHAREVEPRSLGGEEPSRILCNTSQAPNPEYARQDGQIHVRSRTPMNIPGYRGQSQPNVPAVTSAKSRPSIVARIVVPRLRRYQIVICQSASE